MDKTLDVLLPEFLVKSAKGSEIHIHGTIDVEIEIRSEMGFWTKFLESHVVDYCGDLWIRDGDDLSWNSVENNLDCPLIFLGSDPFERSGVVWSGHPNTPGATR